MTRREMIAATATGLGLAARPASNAPASAGLPGPICLFSKHLPGLGPRELARAVKEIGLAGVDLTVRKGGHIAPEKVEADLPPAVAAIRGEGLEVPHITTGLSSGRDAEAVPVLKTAGKLGVRLFRCAHVDYKGDDVMAEGRRIGAELKSLAAVARAHGVQMLYQNHVGNFGAALWDLARVLEPLDPRWAGVEFDVRHAVAEGGATAWRRAFQLVASRVRMICLKDFYWKKGPNGWQLENCPLGEGMVDFPAYFAMLAKAGYRGPVSLHIEYLENGDRPGSESRVLAAAKRDLEYARAQLAKAYGA